MFVCHFLTFILLFLTSVLALLSPSTTSTCVATLSQNKELLAHQIAIDFIRAMIGSSQMDLKMVEVKVQSILKASKRNKLNMTNTTENCLTFLGMSELRLMMERKAVTKRGLVNARAWDSAAFLYQYDCWSTLKYVNGTDHLHIFVD